MTQRREAVQIVDERLRDLGARELQADEERAGLQRQLETERAALRRVEEEKAVLERAAAAQGARGEAVGGPTAGSELQEVEAERAALLEEVEAERAALLEEVEAERVALLEEVEGERAALQGELEEQRVALQEEVDGERAALEAAVGRERSALQLQQEGWTRDLTNLRDDRDARAEEVRPISRECNGNITVM